MIKMKESRIPWIGLVPEHWEMVRVKNIFNNHKNIVGEKESEFERLALTLNGVIKRDKNDSKGLQSENLSTYQILNEKELVFKMIDLANVNTSRVGYSPYTGIVSPVYIILNNDDYSKYGYYYFYSMWQREIFNNLGNDGVRSALNASDMMNLPFPNISVQEAKTIANFLDEKVSEIDSAIEKTKETIEDYKKLKQLLITNTIRNGLNENEELKESKIDWIGKINSKYEIARLKNVAKINGRIGFRGYTQSDIVSEGEGAITISPSNFSNMKMNYSKCQYISWDKYYESPEIQLKNGDILFVKTGSTYGKTCLVQDLPLEATINPQSIIIKPQSINDRYLTYYLNSNLTTYQVEISVVGGTIPTISQEKINNYLIILPPSEEQIAIVEYLDKKCREFDNLIDSKERIVEELEQYKKSVIYEYVTGKKEVK